MRFSRLPLVLGGVACANHVNRTTYDYIIVGGGTSGLVVANRLSEDATKTVLVIENGSLRNDTLSSVPGNSRILNTAAMYPIFGAPVPALGNQTFRVPVGNVVGGGSYVNVMQFDRGSNADYDAWAELGNEGWDWAGLKPYFHKSNHFDPPSPETTEAFGITYDASAYGDGPLRVSIPSWQWPDMKTIFHSWDAVDIPHPKEGFESPLGVFWSPNAVNSSTATRSTSRTAYYDPVASRTNLRLLTDTHVDEIILEEDSSGRLTAAGVKYTPNGSKRQAKAFAAKEVILSAGGVFTPHLLMTSGIGPKDVLHAAGVPVKKDLAAVGSNFQDHVANYMTFNLTNLAPENVLALSTNATFNQTSWDAYLQHRTGPYSVGTSNGLIFLPLQDFDATGYNNTLATLRDQVATDFLPQRYTAHPELLAGFLAQRAILLRRLASHSAAAGEISIQPLGHSTVALQKPPSRGIKEV